MFFVWATVKVFRQTEQAGLFRENKTDVFNNLTF